MTQLLWAAALLAAYALLCIWVWRRHVRIRSAKAAAAAALLPSADAAPPVLVLHASQTGTAEALALQTAQALHLAGLPVRLASLGDIGAADLQAARHALFIVSSYGEGDPPDAAAPFVSALMQSEAQLDHLDAAVLALGDSSYQHFCGFGRALDDWLARSGANALFKRIEVDREDAQALQQWKRNLSHLAGTAELPAFQSEPFAPWRLIERRHLNTGSAGGAVFELLFAPPPGQALPDWEAGDLAQLQIEDGPPREYTIASLPADGHLALMVRQARRADGSLGLASGLLTDGLTVGASASLRLRAHGSFRIGANATRPLVLIGNGTGLAGLRAHLKALALRGDRSAWLIYGERQAAFDTHFATEIENWLQAKVLARVDRLFSRDGGTERYVQHRLATEHARLREWMSMGAAIYVCGSLEGMAGGVDALLRERFGADEIDAWIAEGRYRRDVY